MTWLTWLLIALGLAAVLLTAMFFLVRWLQRREPYRSVLKLRTRAKVSLFKALLADRRVPLVAKSLPVLLVLYLATPIDIVPDILPVIGFMDDIAVIVITLALVVKLTPRAVVDEHVSRLRDA